MKVQVTSSSEVMDTPERRVVDLTDEGLPEIPTLGVNRSVRTNEGSVQHRHDCLELTYCVRGSVKFDCNGRAYTILPGGMFVSTPKDVHGIRNYPKGAKIYWIFLRLPKRGESFFGLDEGESRWFADSIRSFPRKTFVVSSEVQAAFERLFRVLDTEREGSVARRLKLRTAALQLVIAIVEAGVEPSDYDEDARFRAVIDRMRRIPQKEFPMEALTDELKCSLNTVISRFRRFTGLPPQAFLMKCRIHKAMDLLKDQSRTITDIAEELGFASSQHFATRFRQETGKTPRDWRRG